MSGVSEWAQAGLGYRPKKEALFASALTHASFGGDHYERLEFLGDKVLGLTMAAWLFELFPSESEGKLSPRLNQLVSRETCAEVARELGIGAQVKLGKQARDDGAFDSDNILGDVVEALIGALFIDGGLEEATRFIRRAWASRVDGLSAPPKHPKAALQEWTAANSRRPPIYTVVDTRGPDHAPRFKVEVSVRGLGEATGEGTTKQEAETAAAAKLLAQLG